MAGYTNSLTSPTLLLMKSQVNLHEVWETTIRGWYMKTSRGFPIHDFRSIHFLQCFDTVLWVTEGDPACEPQSPVRGLTVIAASMHGLLWPTRNHNHKVVASASAEIFGTLESQ